MMCFYLLIRISLFLFINVFVFILISLSLFICFKYLFVFILIHSYLFMDRNSKMQAKTTILKHWTNGWHWIKLSWLSIQSAGFDCEPKNNFQLWCPTFGTLCSAKLIWLCHLLYFWHNANTLFSSLKLFRNYCLPNSHVMLHKSCYPDNSSGWQGKTYYSPYFADKIISC